MSYLSVDVRASVEISYWKSIPFYLHGTGLELWLYPCSPSYITPDEWLFACSGDATQSDAFPISHLENTRPAALGLGRPGALPAGLVEPCPKPWALIHKPLQDKCDLHKKGGNAWQTQIILFPYLSVIYLLMLSLVCFHQDFEAFPSVNSQINKIIHFNTWQPLTCTVNKYGTLFIWYQ